jgi:hypothetical protein
MFQGTIIISVDYTNGGNVPCCIRVWMDEAVLIVMITESISSFTVDKKILHSEKERAQGLLVMQPLKKCCPTNIWVELI